MGIVKELEPIKCPHTGMKVINWDVTANLPIKFERPKKYKCKHCNGKGYHLEQQAKFNF